MCEETDAVGRLLRAPPRIVNIGLPGFGRDLERCGIDVVRVDWSPPAGGDERMIALLDRLGA